MAAGALNVLLVVAALRLLDLGESGVGAFTAALGAGGVIAGGLLIVRVRARNHGADLAAGLVLFGVPMLLLSSTNSELTTIALLAIVGIGVTVVDVSTVTLLQRGTDRNLLAHVLGLLQATFVASIALGTLLAPLLAASLGIRGALLATGIPLPLLALALWSRLRQLDRGSVAPEWLELLLGDPIFAPLPEHVREQLAARLQPLPFKAGDVVIRQGDRGDGFYLVASGEVSVEVDGRRVGTLGPGASFGEIALLRDVPRTATIRAVDDTLALQLDRESFLGAVGGNRASARAADLLVDSRLGLAAGLSAA
jgi:MFS family permease